MSFPKNHFLTLATIVGLTTSASLFPVEQLAAQTFKSSNNQGPPQNGMIRVCGEQVIELSSPQLTNEELNALTNCSSETIPQLITALESQDWKVKVVAAHTLGLLGIEAQVAVPALSGLIQHENADVRFAAAQALGEIGTEAVVPALTEALQDPDENVRVSAVIAFQNIGLAAGQAKAELIEALWDGNWFVKNGAAKTISKLDLNTSDIPAIVDPLRDNFIDTVILDENFYPLDTEAIISLMLSIYPPVFNKLEDLPIFFIEGLESEDPKVREKSVIALAQISLSLRDRNRLHKSIYALQQVAEDPESKVRASALKSLGQIKGSRFDYREDYEDSTIRNSIESTLLRGLHDLESNVRKVALEYFATSNYISSGSAHRLTVILIALEAIQDADQEIRQTAINVLDNNLDELDSLPSSLKPKTLERVFLALKNALYDRNASVRQNAWSSLYGERRISALVEILQQENIDLDIRYDAFSTMATYGEIIEQSPVLAELLQEALEDSHIGIRVNAASALERAGKMSAQASVPIFIEGLKSETPLVKLHAAFALHKMCSRYPRFNASRCAEAKSALPFLVETLKAEIEPLQYAAALAISDIDSEEESGIPILEEILLEESDGSLRGQAISALGGIDSPNSRLAMIRVELEDKKSRYVRSCRIRPYIPIFENDFYWDNKIESADLLLQALKDPNSRMSASHSFAYFLRENDSFYQGQTSHFEAELRSLPEIQFLVSELTSVLSEDNISHLENPVLQDIFKIKDQDIRRSAIYSLGAVATALQSSDSIAYYYNAFNFPVYNQFNRHAQVRREIIETLTDVVDNQTENLEVRWMAAAQLQAANIPMDDFFLRENLVNPAIALAQSRYVGAMEVREVVSEREWSRFLELFPDIARPIDSRFFNSQRDFLIDQYGHFSGRIGLSNSGLDFDLYSKQYIYDSRSGCGSGLGEVFDTLQRLFNRGSE